jgi:hypothetical protein
VCVEVYASVCGGSYKSVNISGSGMPWVACQATWVSAACLFSLWGWEVRPTGSDFFSPFVVHSCLCSIKSTQVLRESPN